MPTLPLPSASMHSRNHTSRAPRSAPGEWAASWPAILTMAVLLVLGCGDQDVVPPLHPDQQDLFWELDLDHHAVLLAKGKYDSLRLTATPRNYRGDALGGLSTPKYRSTDTDRVAVTLDGVIIAVGRTTTPVAVIATLTSQNLTLADTAMVSVADVEVPQRLASLSIQPIPSDSAKVAVVTYAPPHVLNDTLPVRAFDDVGGAIPIYPYDEAGILPLYFQSVDTTAANVDRNTGVVTGMRVGSVKIMATTNALGVTAADTVLYRVGWPVVRHFHVTENAARTAYELSHGSANNVGSSNLILGTGSTVIWSMIALGPTDFAELVFPDEQLANVRPVAPYLDLLNTIYPFIFYWASCAVDCTAGGNVVIDGANHPEIWTFARHFPVPGVYEYRGVGKAAGIHGLITVMDER